MPVPGWLLELHCSNNHLGKVTLQERGPRASAQPESAGTVAACGATVWHSSLSRLNGLSVCPAVSPGRLCSRHYRWQTRLPPTQTAAPHGATGSGLSSTSVHCYRLLFPVPVDCQWPRLSLRLWRTSSLTPTVAALCGVPLAGSECAAHSRRARASPLHRSSSPALSCILCVNQQ